MFNSQEIANTAWAFATLGQLDEELFAAFVSETALGVSEFSEQGIARYPWISIDIHGYP